MSVQQVPAVEGWFTGGEEPALIGARGAESGSYFFPTAVAVSANPRAPFEEREEVLLSRRGTVWSYTTNYYKPPPPYVAPDPFVPYTVVAVELERERIVVLGLLAADADPAALRVGLGVELTLRTLYADDEGEHTVWSWRPVDSEVE